MLRTVQMILERGGYKVLTASNGQAALELCRSYEGPIHLALLDVLMPGMNGPELRDCLRGLLPTIRILYMSGYSHDEIRHRGIGADLGDFVAKPFTAQQLLERIGVALFESEQQGVAE